MRKCLTLIANTDVWKSFDVELKDKEARIFYYNKSQTIFNESDVYFEKWLANNEYTDNNFHCVVEVVDEKGKPISFFEKTIVK